MVTFGMIRDAGYTKDTMFHALNIVEPISQPTFDLRLKDQNWKYKHAMVFKHFDIWLEEDLTIQLGKELLDLLNRKRLQRD